MVTSHEIVNTSYITKAEISRGHLKACVSVLQEANDALKDGSRNALKMFGICHDGMSPRQVIDNVCKVMLECARKGETDAKASS
jgi:hypothetical protein